MKSIRKSLAALAVVGSVIAAPAAVRAESDAATLELGQEVYGVYCAGCHGVEGDGNGPAAEMLIVKPRDFTSGIFKFRSTPNGTLPTDADLLRIVTHGINRTAMPNFRLVPEVERKAVVAYLKTFFPAWEQKGAGEPIHLPAEPDFLMTSESIARGAQLYDMLDCGRCHGAGGEGDGPSAKTLVPDSWGNPQVPFNFTMGALKGGGEPVDVYRTFMTGLNGTAMPSYADVFAYPDGEAIREGDAWHLVSFILSLRNQGEDSAR